jgi:hypothetical protein
LYDIFQEKLTARHQMLDEATLYLKKKFKKKAPVEEEKAEDS